MGMAATQARWISLAARNTNVEYEGQQINQARLALSNKSSELWTRLYSMEVPTAPSKSDYTTTQYTFKDGDAKYTLENIEQADYYNPDDGLTYNSYVTYTKDVSEYTAIRNTLSTPQVQQTPTGYMVGTRALAPLSTIPEEEMGTYTAQLNQIAKDWPDIPVSKAWTNYLGTGDRTYLEQIQFFMDSKNEVNYTTNEELDACITNPDLPLRTYYSDFQTNKREVSEYAIIEYDSSGRASSMQLQNSTLVYNLDATSVTDDIAYNDAVNNYNYEKQIYEKNVQDINARTEQLQTEDRTLELRLKQLDTERNALQAEMEVMKKIIQKNIDNTFKTFQE